MVPWILAAFSALVGLQSARLQESSQRVKNQIQKQHSQIQKEQHYFEALVKSSPFAVVQLDMDHRIISFNPTFEALFGHAGPEIIGRPLDTIIASDELLSEAEGISQSVSSGKIVKTVSKRMRKDGSLIDVEIIGIPVFVGGEKVGILGLYNDISLMKETERALKDSEARFRSLFDDSPISLWEEDFSGVKKVLDKLSEDRDVIACLKDDDDLVRECVGLVKILNVNQATLDLYNAHSKSEMLASLSPVLTDASLKQFRNELIALVNGARSYECEIMQRKVGGEIIQGLLHLSLPPGYETTWERVFISIINITERKAAEETLRYMSFHDGLTGLYNRAYFDEEMKRLQHSRQFPISIIACDLDDLKRINDTLGHPTGDRAIQAAGVLLAKIVFRKEDVVARIGGDEFAVILPNVDIGKTPSIIERLEQAIIKFNQDDEKDGLYRPISLSYGYAAISKNGSLREGYKRADEQMYANKLRKKRSPKTTKSEP
jgi:diguanylate cyclase (GGDEF)-like protein/PAS domain S-box-containing protein